MVVLRTEDGLIEEHEGFMSLPLAARRAGRARRAGMAARPDGVARRQAGRRRDADGAARTAVRRGRAGGQLPPVRAADAPPVVALGGRPLAGRTPRRHGRRGRRLPAPRDRDRPRRQPRQSQPKDCTWRPRAGSGRRSSCGCAGARALDDGSFRLEPRLPPRWERLRFRWIHRGTLLTVTVSADELTVEAAEGAAAITAPGWTGQVRAGEPLRLSRSAGGWRAAA